MPGRDPRFIHWRSCLLALVLALLPASMTHADFKVAELQARFAEDALLIDGDLQLELSSRVEEALSKGIELPVIVELRLFRKRAFLWDLRLKDWQLRRSLRYHALSGQYIVGTGGNFDSFLSPAEALRHLGALNELRLSLKRVELPLEHDYLVKLRVHIDIESLPAPLRPVAYTTLAWHLNSGWTTWHVPR